MSNPPDFEIAALRKKQQAQWDPLAHGPGTPWEDRATHGTVGAFLKTCFASMFAPRQLVDRIRRPETTSDVRPFVIGCGAFWGLSAAGHIAWALYHKANHPELLDKKTDLYLPPGSFDHLWTTIDLVVPLVGVTVGITLLWMMVTAIYNRLVAEEAKNVKLPEPLIANVAGYAFGPSLLAVIPVVGPPLAVVLMLFSFIAVGTSNRLRLRLPAAIIDALLGYLAITAVAAAGSGVVYLASDRFIPSAVPTMEKTDNEANQPAIRSSFDRKR